MSVSSFAYIIWAISDGIILPVFFFLTSALSIADHALMEMGSSVRNVFYAKVGTKQLNYYEAERLCNILGATLASLDQLTVAYEAGLHRCE